MKKKNSIENAKKHLKKYHQEHVLAFWKQLNADQKQKLIAQIEQLDWAKVNHWIANHIKKSSSSTVPDVLEPASFYSSVANSPQLKKKYNKAKNLGRRIISEGKVAAFVVAGGQGNRSC